MEEEEQVLDQQQAREIAENMAVEEIQQVVPKDAEIVERQLQFFAEDEKEYISITVECTEDIAAQQEIGWN